MDVEIDDLLARISEVDNRIEEEKYKLDNPPNNHSKDLKFKEMNKKMDYEIERYRTACSELLNKWEDMVTPGIHSNPVRPVRGEPFISNTQ